MFGHPQVILYLSVPYIDVLFFFNDTATTEIYTLSLHDALPISPQCRWPAGPRPDATPGSRPWSVSVQLRSEEHTSELQSHSDLVCRLLLEKKNRRRAKATDGQSHDAQGARPDERQKHSPGAGGA